MCTLTDDIQLKRKISPSILLFMYTKCLSSHPAVLPPVDDFVVTSMNGTIVNTRWQHVDQTDVASKPSTYTLYWCKGIVSSSQCRVRDCIIVAFLFIPKSRVRLTSILVINFLFPSITMASLSTCRSTQNWWGNNPRRSQSNPPKQCIGVSTILITSTRANFCKLLVN